MWSPPGNQDQQFLLCLSSAISDGTHWAFEAGRGSGGEGVITTISSSLKSISTQVLYRAISAA